MYSPFVLWVGQDHALTIFLDCFGGNAMNFIKFLYVKKIGLFYKINIHKRDFFTVPSYRQYKLIGKSGLTFISFDR